jgi:hypothetical protein
MTDLDLMFQNDLYRHELNKYRKNNQKILLEPFGFSDKGRRLLDHRSAFRNLF